MLTMLFTHVREVTHCQKRKQIRIAKKNIYIYVGIA